ncbi:unnamed protein product [Soboliphyme baturini]|uniref:Trimeric intracellular cation channel type B n=1 Tax=Soboliphyme baturini TaxID=241478 RepID=A0A183ILN3_9BILA|nr:unnamed protein product [Soboliphyme baturini]
MRRCTWADSRRCRFHDEFPTTVMELNSELLLSLASKVTRLKMYPYFDVAHYILMVLAVREDLANGAVLFSRKHPLSCWMSSMMMYLVFYSPFDVVYRLLKFLPFKIVISVAKEIQRTDKVYAGVIHTMKVYPSAYLLMVIIGAVKGAGSGIIRTFEQLVRGVWAPTTNELLRPTFTTKACLAASLIFVVEKKTNLFAAPHEFVYFAVVVFLIYFKLSSLLLGIHDPFLPFENLFCAIFMGGIWDALR